MTTSTLPYAVRRISQSEQQLVAARSIPAGELIIAEQALVQVSVGRYQYGTYAWDLVDRLLADNVLLQQFSRLRLHEGAVLPHAEDLAAEDLLVKKYRKSRQMVHGLFDAVATNNIGILGPDRVIKGHGLFPFLSRSDHSCVPNAALTPANWRQAEASLVAKRDIKAGEPLTWSYFRETEFLPQDWVTRNYNLVNLFRFACRCPRCQAERPKDVPSSPARQLAYLDALIRADARQMVEDSLVQGRVSPSIQLAGAGSLLATGAR